MRARRTTTLLAAALVPLALTACGVGLDPQTYRARSTQDATNGAAGALALRNVAVEPPAAGETELGLGKDAQLTLAVVNVSSDADRLLSATTPAASSVGLVDGSGHAVTAVDIPANGTAGYGDFGVVLHGLTKALRPGMYIDVTFAFDKNGRSELQVPVKVWDGPVPRESFSAKPAEGE